MPTALETAAAEFSYRRGFANETVRERTPRYYTVTLKLNGVELGTMYQTFKRGKVVSTDYVIPTVDLKALRGF